MSHQPRFYTAPKFLKMGIKYLNLFPLDNFDNTGRNTNTFIVTFKAPTIAKHLHVGYLRVPVSIYIYRTHCAASNARSFVMAKMRAEEGRLVPRVVRLVTATTIVQMRQSAGTVLEVTLPLAKATLNGSLRKGFRK